MKMNLYAALLAGLTLNTVASAECVSCQIHKQGGAYLGTYAAPVYPAQPYWDGRYPPYRNPGYPAYGQGMLKHTCGPSGRCVTTYRGAAGDIRHLPQIDRQIRQTRPSRLHIDRRPRAVPLD